MKHWIAIFSTLLLGACAAYSGHGLKPGVDRLEDVVHVMGQPAMRWQDADGAAQLAYPRGPQGFHTYMAHIAPDGKLSRIENVMDQQSFARIQPGMTKTQVLRILGPAYPRWTEYFAARDELAWEWRYCDTWNDAARFNVLFDNTKETVRTTLSLTEAQKGLCGKGTCWCAH
ncbi:MAG: outer membrane protein assembly factor BamE [Sulfuricellaceae bacterium]